MRPSELPQDRATQAKVKAAGERLLTVVHWRPRWCGQHQGYHAAVAVTPEGECFVGEALCAPGDQYIRKVGYVKSVQRALDRLLRKVPDFILKTDPSGLGEKEIRMLVFERVKEMLEETEWAEFMPMADQGAVLNVVRPK